MILTRERQHPSWRFCFASKILSLESEYAIQCGMDICLVQIAESCKPFGITFFETHGKNNKTTDL